MGLKSKKYTMYDRVEKYINDFGSITTWQAFKDLNCTRLSEYIRQLKFNHTVNDEWVTSKNVYGENVVFKRYWFEEAE